MRLTPMPCTLKEYRQEALTGGRYSNQCTGALHLPASRMVTEDNFGIPMYCNPRGTQRYRTQDTGNRPRPPHPRWPVQYTQAVVPYKIV